MPYIILFLNLLYKAFFNDLSINVSHPMSLRIKFLFYSFDIDNNRWMKLGWCENFSAYNLRFWRRAKFAGIKCHMKGGGEEEAMAKIMGRERLAFIRGSRSGLRSMSRKNSESVWAFLQWTFIHFESEMPAVPIMLHLMTSKNVHPFFGSPLVIQLLVCLAGRGLGGRRRVKCILLDVQGRRTEPRPVFHDLTMTSRRRLDDTAQICNVYLLWRGMPLYSVLLGGYSI